MNSSTGWFRRSHKSQKRSRIPHLIFIGALLLCGMPQATAVAHAALSATPASNQPPSHADRIKARGGIFRQAHYGQRPLAADTLIVARNQAHKLAATSTVGGSWTALGPQPIDASRIDTNLGQTSGRITALAVDPYNSQYVWAGAANGGVWSSNNGGQTWSPKSDFEDTLATGSIAIDPTDPSGNTVYVGTGEANGSNDSYWGIGILRTADGGNSWEIDPTNGMPFGYRYFAGLSVSRIVVDPVNGQVVLAAVCCANTGVTSGQQTSSDAGIWCSTDGGTTWTAVLGGPGAASGGTGDATDLVMDPGDHMTLYAGIARSNQSTSTIWESTDNGVSWSPVTSMPYNPVQRVSLGVARTQAGLYLYAALTDPNNSGLLNQSIYVNSPDTSGQWVSKAVQQNMSLDNGSNKGLWWYDSTIAVDPLNPERVYAGGIDLWRTDDGGNSWSNQTNSGSQGPVHADQHALAYLGSTSSTFYLGNDGGVWTGTPLPGQTAFTDLNGGGLNITQFYGGSVGSGSSSQLYGASQDNGIVQYPVGSIGGAKTWCEVLGGDGLQTTVDPSNDLNVEAEISTPGTSIRISGNGGSTFSQTLDVSSEVNPDIVAPLVISPNNSKELLLGTNQVRKSTDLGNSWSIIGASANFNGGALTSLAVAQGDDNRIFVGSAGGLVWITTNGGSSWNKTAIPSGVFGNEVTGLAINPNNEDTVYVTYADFGKDCPAGGPGCEHVFKSTDRGTTWTDISAILPNAPFESIITVHPKNTGCSSCPAATLLVAGSDVGVFVSADAGTTWSQLGGNLPDTEVDQVFADKNGAYIYAATHGRGMWRIAAPYLGNPIKLLALKATTGALVWSYTFPTTESQATGIAAANGNIFIGVYGAGSPLLEAFNGTSGALLWTYTSGLKSPWPGAVAPIVANGAVYLGINDVQDLNQDGYLIAVNASTGVPLWRTLVGEIQATVAADSTQVYVPAIPYAGSGPDFFALNATTGAIDWSVELTDQFSTPAVANGTVYVAGGYFNTCGNSNCLYALNATTGALEWLYQMSDTGQSQASPAVAGGMVYLGSSDNTIYAVDATSGMLVWKYLAGARGDDAAVANGVIYVPTTDGYIHSLDATNGVPNWDLLTNSYYYPRPVIGP